MSKKLSFTVLVFSIMLFLGPIALFAIGDKEAENKVVLYTAHKETIVEAMLPRFKAETGIEPEYVKMGSGEVIRRAKAEKDIIEACDESDLETYIELGEAAFYGPKLDFMLKDSVSYEKIKFFTLKF